MSEAPKEIWAVAEPDDISADILGAVYAQQLPDGMVGQPVKYTRTDLAQAAAEKAVADALREVARKLRADIDACCFGEFDDEAEKGLRRGMYASLHTINSLIPPEQQEGE